MIVDIFWQTGWEDKVSHQDGKIDLTLTESVGQKNWLLYERDLMIQEDMEWLLEAVFTFYRKHLDKLIRENDRMWGYVCQKKYDDDGNEIGLELNTSGCDMTDPHVEVSYEQEDSC